MCIRDSAVIILDEVRRPMLDALVQHGGALRDTDEKKLIQMALWHQGRLNRGMLARSPEVLCELSGLGRKELRESAFMMVEEEGVGPEYPFSGEKLSPLMAVYGAADFEEAINTAERLLNHQGKGHSIGLHTGEPERALELGKRLPVCRVIVNQPHCFATGGSFENGLPFSLSMGCGSWGGNSIDDNLNYRHFLNITRISMPISTNAVEMEEMFSEYRARHGL